MNLLTRMKSPTKSVGIMDPDGILNGSTTNERSTNTIRITGKKLLPYSIHHGSRSSFLRFLAKWAQSANAAAPVTISREKSNRAKFMREPSHGRTRVAHLTYPMEVAVPRSSLLHLKDREKRLLRNFHGSHLLHAFLSRLLLLQELPLARHVPAVALRQNVLAQRLDGLPRNDMRADRRLNRHIEHLARYDLAHLEHEIATPIGGVLAVHHER